MGKKMIVKEPPKCPECGKKNSTYQGYCSYTCWIKNQLDEEMIKKEKQKFEEIKSMAFKIYTRTYFYDRDKDKFCRGLIADCWEDAEKIYNFAKARENNEEN